VPLRTTHMTIRFFPLAELRHVNFTAIANTALMPGLELFGYTSQAFS